MPYRQLMEGRLSFLNIDQDTISELRNAKAILEPAMDDMLDNFYSHILDEPELKPIFSDKSEIDRARTAQKKHWLEAMFNGKYDNTYYEKTLQIGRAHARIGLTPNWYIGGYNKMLCQFIDIIYENYAQQGHSAKTLIQAVSKIIFLDMDLVIHCYLDAKDEALRRLLTSSSEQRAEIWKYSDDLTAVSNSIDSSASAILEDLKQQNQQQKARELQENIDALKTQTANLEKYLESLPLSEKLYLPEPGLFSMIKNSLFGKTYQHHNKAE